MFGAGSSSWYQARFAPVDTQGAPKRALKILQAAVSREVKRASGITIAMFALGNIARATGGQTWLTNQFQVQGDVA